MKVLIILFVLFVFSCGAVSAQHIQILKVESNHLSVDLNVYDCNSKYYVRISNNSNSNLEISVRMEINTKCGKTMNFVRNTQILAHKYDEAGQWADNIETSTNCKGGVESAILVSMSVKDLTKELIEQESKRKTISNVSSSNSDHQNESNKKPQAKTNTPPNQPSSNYKEIADIDERQNRVRLLEQQQELAKKETAQKHALQLEQSKKNAEIYQQQSDALVNTVTEIVNIFEEEAERKRIKEAKERESRKRDEEQQRLLKENFEANIKSRKDIIAEFKQKDIPISSAEKATKIYYFIYAYDADAINNKTITIYISNVFVIGKYGDGTWPYMSTIRDESQTLTAFEEIFHGYYYNVEDAEAMRKSFIDLISRNNGVAVKEIYYKGKPLKENINKTNDFWGTKSGEKSKDNFAPASLNTPKATENTSTLRNKEKTEPAITEKKTELSFWD